MPAVTFSLPSDLNTQLESQVWEEHRAKSEVIQDALRLYLSKKQKESAKNTEKKGA